MADLLSVARDTIFALASGRPPAAIAILRISGPQAHGAAARLAGDLPEPRRAVLRQVRHPSSGELLDEALLLRFDGPASATGEDLVELYCHGSRAVVDAVLGALSGLEGLRSAEPGEFTRRAFENGRIDLTEAEGLADLLEAETEWQRRAALALADGGLRRQVDRWREQLVSLSAEAEAAIDYVDEYDKDRPRELYRDCEALAIELDRWLERPRVEPLKHGIRVALGGPANAGKSSLLNALTGCERAIVTDVAGTTRDYLEVPVALGGHAFVLIDTAGLRDGVEPVERIGVERAQEQIAASDILLWLGKPMEAPEHPSCILLQPKADLAQHPPKSSPQQLAVSAHTGLGLAELTSELVARARTLLPAPDAIALNRRQAVHLSEAAKALARASSATDIVLAAEDLRSARVAFDQLTGRAGIEDVLDALFGRFCLGK